MLDTTTTTVHIGDDCEVEIVLLLLGGNKKKQPKITTKMVQQVTQALKARNSRVSIVRPRLVAPRQRVNTNQAKSQFALAMRDPFSPAALGVTVPAPDACLSAPYHARGVTVMKSPNGFAGLLFTPNPLVSMLDFLQDTGAATCVSSTGMSSYGANPQLYGISTYAALSTQGESFRHVTGGLLLRNRQAPLSATGSFIIAQLPIGDTIPDYNTLTSYAASAGTLGAHITGEPSAYLLSSQTLSFPGAFRVDASDFLRGDLLIPFSYNNASFFTFKNLASNPQAYSASLSVGDNVAWNSTTGVVTSGAQKDSTRCQGGNCIIIYAEGCPTNIALLEIEYIEHLELLPVGSSGFVPGGTGRRLAGSTAAVEEGMAQVSNERGISWLQAAQQFLNANGGAIARGALQIGRTYMNARAHGRARIAN
jgi:hypothetical protein